jgi:hypothetical protein
LEENLKRIDLRAMTQLTINGIRYSTIHNLVSEVLGNIAVEHHNDWYDVECHIATEKKNKAYAIMQQRRYARASVEANRAVRNGWGDYIGGETGNMRLLKFKQ